MDQELNAHNYRTHEFGDSVFLENTRLEYQCSAAALNPHAVCSGRHRFHVLPLTLFGFPVSEHFLADVQAQPVIAFEL